MTPGRAKRLAMQEAYRPITVREGDEVFTLPTIQAVMRQRAFIDRVHAIEEEMQAATKATETAQNSPVTDLDRAQALAALLAKTGYKLKPSSS
jgi:hypothetical protein